MVEKIPIEKTVKEVRKLKITRKIKIRIKKNKFTLKN